MLGCLMAKRVLRRRYTEKKSNLQQSENKQQTETTASKLSDLPRVSPNDETGTSPVNRTFRTSDSHSNIQGSCVNRSFEAEETDEPTTQRGTKRRHSSIELTHRFVSIESSEDETLNLGAGLSTIVPSSSSTSETVEQTQIRPGRTRAGSHLGESEFTWDELAKALEPNNVPNATLHNLCSHTEILLKAKAGAVSQENSNTIIADIYKSVALWLDMIKEVHKFRDATNFNGPASDWPEHKVHLRSGSRNDLYMIAMKARQRLKSFATEKKQLSKWYTDKDSFAYDVAVFYDTVIHDSIADADDLAYLFTGFNTELLTWFET